MENQDEQDGAGIARLALQAATDIKRIANAIEKLSKMLEDLMPKIIEAPRHLYSSGASSDTGKQ